MEDFTKIIVMPGPVVKIINPTGCRLIGKGSQGAVFELTPDICVKIFSKEKSARKEASIYKDAQSSSIIPKLYGTGSNYIVMEYVKGISFKDYLREKGDMPKSVAKGILHVLKEIERLGFPRLDWSLRHIFLTPEGKIKVVDLGHGFKEENRRPQGLFDDLRSIGLLSQFLKHVRRLDPRRYQEWKDDMSEYF